MLKMQPFGFGFFCKQYLGKKKKWKFISTFGFSQMISTEVTTFFLCMLLMMC